MTTAPPILCMACTRLDQLPAETCQAYPDGIRLDILNGADHHQPYGDEVDGLVFESRGDAVAEIVLDVWRPTVGAS